MQTACPPMLVNLSTIIDDEPDQISDDDQTRNQDRAALVANDKRPGLMKLLLKDSSAIAVGGCKVIFRVSTMGSSRTTSVATRSTT